MAVYRTQMADLQAILFNKEAGLKALFENSTVATLIVNSHRKIQVINPAAETLFGFKKAELSGKLIDILIPEDSREVHIQQHANYYTNPVAHKMAHGEQVFARKKNGSLFPVLINLCSYHSGGEMYVIACITDLTDSKETEEKLRQNEERYRQIFNGIEEVFMMQKIIRDDDGKIVDLLFIEVNPAFVKLLNKPASEIIGHLRTEFFGPMDDELKDIINRVESGENIPYAQHFPTIGRWFHRHFDSPKPELLVSINMDITESKQEEEALLFLSQANHKLWRIDSPDEGLEEILSSSIALLRADKGTLQLYDEEKNVLVIKKHKRFDNKFLELFHEVGIDDNTSCGRALKLKSQVVIEDTEKDSLFEPYREIARKYGIRAVQSTPMYASNGLLLGVISTHFSTPQTFDTKQLRRMQLYARKAESFIERFRVYEAMRKLNAQLEEKIKLRTKELIAALEHEKELNEIKSRFVSTASHEFRTPLSVILSSIQFVESYNKPGQEEKRIKHIERIKTSVKNLTELLNDFLSLEQLEQGKLEKAPEAFSLRNFCHDMKDEMTLTLKSGQRIILSYEGEDQVKQDKKILRNVIANLLSNAIKYSSEMQEIFFHVVNKNGLVKLEVQDEGIGIPQAEQKNIFSKFYRAANAANFQGTGLGLNIVKKYVELLNGEIGFTSLFNEGSVFTVVFPQKL